jgi:hypothetical protein
MEKSAQEHPRFAQSPGGSKRREFMAKPKKEQLEVAMALLERAAWVCSESAPDREWFKDYYLLTGDHMILTDEGWCSGLCKDSLLRDYPYEKPQVVILDEVNAPN